MTWDELRAWITASRLAQDLPSEPTATEIVRVVAVVLSEKGPEGPNPPPPVKKASSERTA